MLRVQNNRHNEYSFNECIKCLSECFIGIRILFNNMIEQCNSYNNDINNEINNDINNDNNNNDNDINNDISNSVDSLDNDTQNKNVTILISPKKKQFSPKNIHFRDRVEETYNLTRPIPIKDTINTMEIPKIINLTVNNIKLVLDDNSITDKKTDEIIENNNDELDGFELL